MGWVIDDEVTGCVSRTVDKRVGRFGYAVRENRQLGRYLILLVDEDTKKLVQDPSPVRQVLRERVCVVSRTHLPTAIVSFLSFVLFSLITKLLITQPFYRGQLDQNVKFRRAEFAARTWTLSCAGHDKRIE